MSEVQDYPNPTEEMLSGDPLFDAIWKSIKGWDISRHNNGMYSGPSGNDARHIYDAILASGLPAAIEARDKAMERVKALEEIVALEVSMTKAAQDVCLERSHQQTREGWTYEHDDEHFLGEMAAAAACYALYGNASTHQHNVGPNLTKDIWPWSAEWWKPKDDKRKNLVRAGALIIAEIERLDRAALRSHP